MNRKTFLLLGIVFVIAILLLSGCEENLSGDAKRMMKKWTLKKETETKSSAVPAPEKEIVVEPELISLPNIEDFESHNMNFDEEVMELTADGEVIIKNEKGEVKQEEYAPDRIIIKFKENENTLTFLNDIQKGTANSAITRELNRKGGISSSKPVHTQYFTQARDGSYEPVATSFEKKREVLETKAQLQIEELQQAQLLQPQELQERQMLMQQNIQAQLEHTEDQKLENAVVVTIESLQTDVLILTKELEEEYSDEIEYAEPDYIVTIDRDVAGYREYREPNDPYFYSRNSWDQGYEDLWGLHKIDIEDAWETTTGSDEIIVAVIDTGVDIDHPDLEGNIWVNEAELEGEEDVDDDENGYVDDIYGWNFAISEEGNNNIADGHGHGTHCAGTIGAVGDNERGVVGINWNVKIMALKGLSDSGSGYSSRLASAIHYAADNGAHVLSNSWGGRGWLQTLTDAVDYAHDLGATIITSAGNRNDHATKYQPANIPKVITVGATDYDDERADFSNYGSKVDVFAPGVDTLSLRAEETDMYANGQHIVGEEYYRASGTSMACPHVAGLAALLLADNPELTNEEIRQILRTTTDNIGEDGWEYETSYGRINANQAINSESVCAANIISPIDSMQYAGDIIVSGEIDIQFTAYCENLESFSFEESTGLEGNEWREIEHEIVSEPDYPLVEPYVVTIDTSMLLDGVNTLRLNVADEEENVFSDTVILNVNNIEITFPNMLHSIKREEIEIEGSVVYTNLNHYTIEYGIGEEPEEWSSEGIELTNNGRNSIENGVLATWDTSSLEDESGFYVLRLTVVLGDDIQAHDYSELYFDPFLKDGWPVSVGYIISEYLVNGKVPDVTIGDLDRDGNIELIYPSISSNELFVFNSDGTIKQGWPQETTGIADRFANFNPSLADLDGDGTLEVILPSTSSEDGHGYYGYINVWHHNGEGMDGWPVRGPVHENPYIKFGLISQVSVDDIDGDGSSELIGAALWVDYERGFVTEVIVWNADGSIADGWPVDIYLDRWVRSHIINPSVGDVNLDGNKEILIPDYRNSLYLFDHQGNLIDGWPIEVPLEISNSPALADINNDGYLEIILNNGMNYENEECRHRDKNDHIFAWHYDGSLVADYPFFIRDYCGGGPYYVTSSVAVGDLERNGELELTFGLIPVLTRAKLMVLNSFPVSLRWSDGSYRRYFTYSSPVIGDITGDGNSEIVIRTSETNDSRGEGIYNRKVYAFQSDGEIVENFPFMAPGGIVSTPVLSDFDGDGQVEISAVSSSGYIYVWDIDAPYNERTMDWPMVNQNVRRTGVYTRQPIHSIPLLAGWNLISSYRVPENLDIEAVFSDLIEHNVLEIVKDEHGNFFMPEWEFNNIGDWTPGEAYQVRVTEDVNLLVFGQEYVNPVVRLEAGHNLMGYPLPEAKDMDGENGIIERLFQPLVDDGVEIHLKNDDGQFYRPEYDYNNIPQMVPEEGYEVYVSEAVELNFSSVLVVRERELRRI